MRCSEAVKVFLVGDSVLGVAQVIGMREASPSVWEVDLDLPPGEFRFCYYLYDGRTIRYEPPAGLRLDGLKAVLHVADDAPAFEGGRLACEELAAAHG